MHPLHARDVLPGSVAPAVQAVWQVPQAVAGRVVPSSRHQD